MGIDQALQRSAVTGTSLLVLVLALGSAGCGAEAPYAPRDGDIIFHTSRSEQSKTIQLATGCTHSHVGLVILEEERPLVYEASDTVRATPLADWIACGEGQHFEVRRLKAADELLTESSLSEIREGLTRFVGKPYDRYFGWANDQIYCSELIWKVYEEALGLRLGELRELGDFNVDHPLVRRKMQERYGERIPWGEQVISPCDLFDSEHLKTVYKR